MISEPYHDSCNFAIFWDKRFSDNGNFTPMDDPNGRSPAATQSPGPTGPRHPALAADGAAGDPATTDGSPAALAALAAAMDFAAAALAPATLRAYRADWTHFLTWCRAAGWTALPGVAKTWSDYAAIGMTSHGLRRPSRTAALTSATRCAPRGDHRMRCFLPIRALAISSTHPSALEVETGCLPW